MVPDRPLPWAPGRTSALSRHDTPEFCLNLSPLEGAGKAGRLMHPQPRMQKWKAYELVTTGTPKRSGPPCAMVLTTCFVLSPAIGLCVTVIGAMRSIVANLMSASRHQDHTTSPSTPARFVEPCRHVHCIPHPTFVTIAKRPSDRGRTGEAVSVICPSA